MRVVFVLIIMSFILYGFVNVASQLFITSTTLSESLGDK